MMLSNPKSFFPKYIIRYFSWMKSSKQNLPPKQQKQTIKNTSQSFTQKQQTSSPHPHPSSTIKNNRIKSPSIQTQTPISPISTPITPISTTNDLTQITTRIRQQGNSPINHNYQHIEKLRNWLDKQCIPVLTKPNLKTFLRDQNIYDSFFSLCNKAKIYRNIFIQIAKNNLSITNTNTNTNTYTNTNYDRRSTVSFPSHIRSYQYFIFMKCTNFELIQKIRQFILNNLSKFQLIEQRYVFNFIQFLQSLFLDYTLTNQQKNLHLQKLSKLIQTNIKIIQNNQQPHIFLLSSLHEQLLLYNLNNTINPKFLKITENAHRTIRNFMNTNVNNSNRYYQKWNINKIYYTSTFQKIFSRNLKEFGYVFEEGQFVKGNQYDVIVVGEVQREIRPFSGIDVVNNVQDIEKMKMKMKQYITPEKLNLLIKRQDRLHKPSILQYKKQDKVVLNLNGPIHYIDTDSQNPTPSTTTNTTPNYMNLITRKQQFKYQKLALYGIYKYNIIDYKEWEQVSKLPKSAQKWLRNKIANPYVLGKSSVIFQDF